MLRAIVLACLTLLPVSAQAALDVANGTITVTTGAVSTTFTVSALPFQPEAIYFFWSGVTSVTSAEADTKPGHGIAVSTASRRVFTAQSDHAAGTSAADTVRYNDCVVATLTIAGVLDGKADLDAILSDGFRLIIDDQFAAAVVVGWIAYGGTDLTNASITDFAEPGATGNQDINVGFALDTGIDDKALIILGNSDSAFGTVTGWASFGLGFAAGNTIVNTVCNYASQDAQANMITWTYCRTGDVLAGMGDADTGTGDAVGQRASVTTWLSTGFRLNWAEIDAGTSNYAVLALKGGRWQVGDALTSTGTSNQVESTAYQPKGIIVASHAKAASASDTTSAEGQMSVGAATAAASRRVASWLDDDAPTTSDIAVGFREDEMYVNYDEANALKTTLSGLMDLVSFDATPSITYVMDDADPSAMYWMYLLAADTPAAPGACANFIALMGAGCK